MSEIDETAREDGYCGYIGDGRENPCRLVERWGYDNATTGLCRNHDDRGGKVANQNATGNSGGPPESNDNAVTHGAFKENFRADLTDGERAAVNDVVAELEDPRSAQEIARNVAADYLIKYQRTGDVRFGQRFESICEKFNIAPSEETEHNHRHAHIHKHGHDRELTERQQAALDNITGGYEPGEVEGEAVVSNEESGDGESDEGDTFEIGW